mmetsp:Transcript_15688/g.49353  ORF Transcript_15688/g.49353 Transcript_15688/m.49353 type:complete len:293 (-) Transcript_15688:201-1079(-)
MVNLVDLVGLESLPSVGSKMSRKCSESKDLLPPWATGAASAEATAERMELGPAAVLETAVEVDTADATVVACFSPLDLLLPETDTPVAVVAALTSERTDFFRWLDPGGNLWPTSPCPLLPREPKPERKSRQTLSKAWCKCATEAGCSMTLSCRPARLCSPPRSACTGCDPLAAMRRTSCTGTMGVTSLCTPTRNDQSVAGWRRSRIAISQTNMSPPLLAFTSNTELASPPVPPLAVRRHSSAAMSSKSCNAFTAVWADNPATCAAAATAASESAMQEHPASFSVRAGASPSR